MIAHGVSRGLSVKGNQPRRGARFRAVWLSVAPLGLGIHNPRPPTADAVGYCLSALRAWEGRARGAEHRQTIAHGVSRGLKRERDPAPEGRKIPGGLSSVAPLVLGSHNPYPPTAHAVGYCLSALRAWGLGSWVGLSAVD